MIEKFWEKIGENLAGEWDWRRLGPALVFWAGGILIWGAKGNAIILAGLFQLTVIQAGMVIILALVVVTLSTLAVSTLTLPILRIFEGYWTPWPFNTHTWLRWIWPFRYIQLSLTKWTQRGWERRFQGEYQRLAGNYVSLDGVEGQRFAYLDAELLTAYPKQTQLFLPTQIGNLLRAVEEYPQYWYGLQVTVTWPRLWLLLPEAVQKEIVIARQMLDKSITWMLWAILFSAWVMLSWWAVILSLIAAFIFLNRVYTSAQIYGELIRAAYDLHRFELYKSLKWPLPKTPAEERIEGEKITLSLRRRQTPEGFSYQFTEEKK
jgi:hypothetical protein